MAVGEEADVRDGWGIGGGVKEECVDGGEHVGIVGGWGGEGGSGGNVGEGGVEGGEGGKGGGGPRAGVGKDGGEAWVGGERRERVNYGGKEGGGKKKRKTPAVKKSRVARHNRKLLRRKAKHSFSLLTTSPMT